MKSRRPRVRFRRTGRAQPEQRPHAFRIFLAGAGSGESVALSELSYGGVEFFKEYEWIRRALWA